FNGERFGVMAGVGFDALMIRDSSRRMKDRLGRAAYVYGSEEPETSLGGRRGARAETLPVVAIAAVAFVSLRVILRRWREAALITLSVAGEAAIFVCITALVDRERPDVMRLDEA